MKKYLQSCNMSGSLYGKKVQKQYGKQDSVLKSGRKKDRITSYDDLYKTQYVAMEKLFNKSK